MKKLLFIYNPNAGKGRIKDHLANILDIFQKNGYEPEVYRTTAPRDGERKAKECGSDYDLIVCFGGDGTLSEIVSGVMALSERPPIGFIPAGSTNDTAKTYDLPLDIEEAAKVAVTGVPAAFDVGSLGDRYFVYVASFGDISAVSAFTPPEAKKRFGHAAYVIEGLKTLPKMRFQPMTVEYDDSETVEGEFYLGMVTNSLQVGGFPGITGKSVDLRDGRFEVLILAKPRNILDLEKQVEDVLIRKDDSSVDVTYGKLPEGEEAYEVVTKFKAGKIRFHSEEEVQWVVDGEDAGIHKDVTLINHQKAIRIMVKED